MVRRGALVAAAAVLAGVVRATAPRLAGAFRRRRSTRGAARFARALGHVRRRQTRLNALAWSAERPDVPLLGIPLLVPPGWMLPRPVPLDQVRIAMVEPPAAELLAESRRRARTLLPRRADGGRYAGYGQALVELGGMAHLFDGAIYRPVAVRPVDGTLAIDFCLAGYFDYLDTSSVLGFELAGQDLAGRAPVAGGAYRRFLGTPFDLRRRVTGLGVCTLTIRRDGPDAGFFLHRRDDAWVTEATDQIHVIPAGDFAPAACDPGDPSVDGESGDRPADFALWRHVMREYLEEFLDLEDGDRSVERGLPALDRAHREGRLTTHAFGVGLDPLTWKPALLTACVFDADVFDTLLGGFVTRATEGTILAGPDRTGLPFTEDAVHRYASDPAVAVNAVSCLRLAWRHRAALGLVPDAAPPAPQPDLDATADA
ncbi:MAG TPA: hypothetical protein VGD67_17035 [Pseudonocardiaceae bacterium]